MASKKYKYDVNCVIYEGGSNKEVKISFGLEDSETPDSATFVIILLGGILHLLEIGNHNINNPFTISYILKPLDDSLDYIISNSFTFTQIEAFINYINLPYDSEYNASQVEELLNLLNTSNT